jgi:hypothetical protein
LRLVHQPELSSGPETRRRRGRHDRHRPDTGRTQGARPGRPVHY